MKAERAILISFLGNYLINTVVAALVALVPAGSTTGPFTPQYISFVVAALIGVAVLAWWYGAKGLRAGILFGVIGFLVAVVTAFITGIAGVVAQTKSLSAIAEVLPNFLPFLAHWSTLVLLGYWMIPSALVGWYMQSRKMSMPMSSSGGM